MARIRTLIKRYPIAAAAVLLGAVALAGMYLYQTMLAQPVAQTPPPRRPAATRPNAPSASGPATPGPARGTGAAQQPAQGTTARPATPQGGAAGTLPSGLPAPAGMNPASPPSPKTGPSAGTGTAGPAGMTAEAPARPPTAPPPPPRQTPATGGRVDPFASPLGIPGGVGLPLPPVPPLAPGGMPDTGSGGFAYRVAGILGRIAILEDGTRSFIVQPGDMLAPGLQVVAVDSGRGVVALLQNGRSQELRLDRGGKAP